MSIHRGVALLLALTAAVSACGDTDRKKGSARTDDDDDDEPRKKPRASATATESAIAITTPSFTLKPVPVPLEPPPSPAAVTFKIDKTEFKERENIVVTFSAPLNAPTGQQYWITLIKADAPEKEFGAWHYVPAGASSDTLQGQKAGDFEVRLHDLYPLHKEGKVLARQRVKIVKAAATPSGPFVPKSGFCGADSDCPAGYYCGMQGNCFPNDPPKKRACSLGDKYWGPCGRTGCNAGYFCADDGHCVCNR